MQLSHICKSTCTVNQLEYAIAVDWTHTTDSIMAPI